MWAAAQSQAEMVKFLASKGADLNARGIVRKWERKVITEPRPKDMNQGGFTPLLYAAREGCVECAKHLVAAGADPDLEDPDRVTPLNMALLNLHFEFAAYMIKAGADLDKWDFYGRSPVYMAADVSTLPTKGNGAMAVLPSEDKITALDVGEAAAREGRQSEPPAEAASAVPRRPAGSRRRRHPRAGRDAAAARRTRRRCAVRRRCCLKHDALVDLPSKEGVTPLMAAAGVEFGTRVTRGRNRTDEGVLATMKLLVDAGANVNARMLTEPRRETFDASVAQATSTRPASADVRARSHARTRCMDQTAIMGAAERGYTPFVKLLAEHGADLTLKDAIGRTALDLAKGVGVAGVKSAVADPHPDTVALLESMGATKKGLGASP